MTASGRVMLRIAYAMPVRTRLSKVASERVAGAGLIGGRGAAWGAGRRAGPQDQAKRAMDEGYGLAARLSTGHGLQCVQRFTERYIHVVCDRGP